MLKHVTLGSFFFAYWCGLQCSLTAQPSAEEISDYYRKWLEQDVFYIVNEEEKEVFNKLVTDEEREQFIEQFWLRRDTDPSTALNEFKEEHYRRVAFVNERFNSGKPGWMTDRGRIYIIHGPPDQIDSHPSGGYYRRSIHEGGGTTSTYPFEVWRYRHIEGLGADIELEFVDPTFSGEFYLAHRPEEKDALLQVPTMGLTLAEEMGVASRNDHPYFSPAKRDEYPFRMERARDNPFTRYLNYVQVQTPPDLKYKELKELVKVDISYDQLQFQTLSNYFKLNQKKNLVTITLQIQNRDLLFQEENGSHVAKLAIYGLVTSITNRVATEFEEDGVISYSPQDLVAGLKERSVYQKIVFLDQRIRYKLDLVVKDLQSGRIGAARMALNSPPFDVEGLIASSLVLSNSMRDLEHIPDENEMFVIGDVRVRPEVDRKLELRRPLGVYFQLYNVTLDQASFRPDLSVRYKILGEDRVVKEFIDERGESVQFASDGRVVLASNLGVADLQPGQYRLEVSVLDRVQQERSTFSQDFRLVDSSLQ